MVSLRVSNRIDAAFGKSRNNFDVWSVRIWTDVGVDNEWVWMSKLNWQYVDTL